jgi:hypothetical protein
MTERNVSEKAVPVAAYEEFVEFIARGGGPEAVIAFHPSEAAQNRAYELVYKERDATLTPQETAELNHYMELEHLFRMAKARARLLIADRAA